MNPDPSAEPERAPQGAKPPVLPARPSPEPPPLPTTTQAIYFNRVRLSEPQLRQLEAMYRTRIPPGAYWYDKVCGAWGMEGGPCRGLIQAGLALGGPLRPDASSGNTGVFINGRQLHLLDMVALQQITMVMPGRYWVDASGNAGFEGGPAMVNLWALASAAASGGGVKREGILSTYDKTGVAVFGY